MAVDRTWQAVFQPARATSFFERTAPPALQHDRDDFHLDDAWWLAELSRIAYLPEQTRTGKGRPAVTRRAVLEAAGLVERAFVDEGGSQALVVAPAGDPPPYVVVAFRGSDDVQAWVSFNIPAILSPWAGGGFVHLGFKAAFLKVQAGIEAVVPADVPVIYTGHSLGGAMALLAASHRPGVATYTFGAPRVGNDAFARSLESAPVYRVVNHQDVVTELPPPVGVTHVGSLRYIDGGGRVRTDPSYQDVWEDRSRVDPLAELASLVEAQGAEAPGPIADHAPVNYVARLAAAATDAPA